MVTLTAPIKWLGHTVRNVRVRPGGIRGRSPWPDFGPGRGEEDGRGGVREPRRPKSSPPAGAMALPEPTEEKEVPSI
jgi:hypothetical protein